MSIWLALILIVTSSAVAIAGILLVRRRAPEGAFFADSDRAAGVFGVLGTAFAVLLAFVIFLALESYAGGKERAGQEAVAVTQLYRTTALFPEPVASELRGELVCYGRAVIAHEWPIMGAGRGSESARVQGWLDKLGTTIAAYAPRGPRAEIGYEQWFNQDAERREGRRGRLAEARPFVPPLIWMVLGLGALLVVGYMLLFADPRERRVVQATMIGGVTALVMAGLLIVAFLDTPFGEGGGRIEPGEMRRTLALIEATTLPAGSRPATPPCDATGA